MSEVVPEGSRLIESWLHAQERLRRAKSEVNSSECDVANTTNALGKWLCPHDAAPGESFCVWHGDSLLRATVLQNGDVTVDVRSRGKRGVRP